MNIARRTLFRSSSCISLLTALIAVSGCTASAGPDAAVATYGIVAAQPLTQAQLSTNTSTAPDQSPAVVVGTGNASDPLAAIAQSQAFSPGAAPPSAVLPSNLTVETSINPNAGAVANSGNYVTDGVEKSIGDVAQSAAPLTPSDVAGQVPAPVELQANAEKQVASLEVQTDDTQPALAVTDPVVAPKAARAVAEKKPTLFGNLFGSKPKETKQSLTASADDGAVQLASLENEAPRETQEMSALPGVNSKNLFALDPATGDEPFDDQPEIQVASASAAGLARLAPNGLLKQTDRVDVACFRPELVSVLKKIEAHYGRKVVVTSGYRSSKGNRRAGGSRNSLHISCAAADIQISGVGKWQLAKYLRSMPGRGGVGTYCHTDSVHIDVGSERDWNWRCRRR